MWKRVTRVPDELLRDLREAVARKQVEHFLGEPGTQMIRVLVHDGAIGRHLMSKWPGRLRVVESRWTPYELAQFNKAIADFRCHVLAHQGGIDLRTMQPYVILTVERDSVEVRDLLNTVPAAYLTVEIAAGGEPDSD